MSEELVNINVVWAKGLPSGVPCAVCEEYIFSSQYRLYVNVGSREIDTDVCVCESCYPLIKEDAVSKQD